MQEHHTDTQEQHINTNFIECKSPQAKDKHADKILASFERDYSDIDTIIQLMDKEEAKLKTPQEAQESQLQEESTTINIDRQKNELDRAMDSVLNARSVIDIIKALYAIEKAMYELKIASNKPDPQTTQKDIENNKGKPLTIDFLKTSIQKLRAGKKAIMEFSKHIKLERAFAKELGKDITMHSLTTQNEKSTYEKRINKKLTEAKEKFPDFQKHFPIMLKNATAIIESPTKTQVVSAGLHR